MTNIRKSDGYKKLLAAAERDEVKSPGFHDYMAKVKWVVERAEHYAEKTGLAASDILNTWEGSRDYWYMNYYQDSRQPLLTSGHVRVFDNIEQFQKSTVKSAYRCPRCKGQSTDAYACNSGDEMDPGKVCDWKSYGLFGTMGLGAYVFLKSAMRGECIFMPVAWEPETADSLQEPTE